MINVNVWLTLGGMAAVGSVLGALLVWMLKQVIREEIRKSLRPMDEDIQTLKVATFNHLTHGERPDEAAIRAALGFTGRRNG